jgi:hypothetical protein
MATHLICICKPGSSVNIVSGYGLDDRAIEVRSPAGEKDFSSNLCIQTGSGAHPTSCPMGTGDPFPGGKAQSGRDADHSPHLVARSWMSRSYTSSPPQAPLWRVAGLLYLHFTHLIADLPSCFRLLLNCQCQCHWPTQSLFWGITATRQVLFRALEVVIKISSSLDKAKPTTENQWMLLERVSNRGLLGIKILSWMLVWVLLSQQAFILWIRKEYAWKFPLYFWHQRNYNFYGNNTSKCSSDLYKPPLKMPYVSLQDIQQVVWILDCLVILRLIKLLNSKFWRKLVHNRKRQENLNCNNKISFCPRWSI